MTGAGDQSESTGTSPLVQELEVTELVEEASVQFLRAKAEMRDGSLLYVRGYAVLLSRSNAGRAWSRPLKLSCRLSW